tara:strand:- start:7 stop:309 length:303 start_codon:yes stop_codon:yes gene_type:complete
MLNTHVEHATNDHACLTNEDGFDIAVLKRIPVTTFGSNAHKISDEEWETLVNHAAISQKAIALARAFIGTHTGNGVPADLAGKFSEAELADTNAILEGIS